MTFVSLGVIRRSLSLRTEIVQHNGLMVGSFDLADSAEILLLTPSSFWIIYGSNTSPLVG